MPEDNDYLVTEFGRLHDHAALEHAAHMRELWLARAKWLAQRLADTGEHDAIWWLQAAMEACQ